MYPSNYTEYRLYYTDPPYTWTEGPMKKRPRLGKRIVRGLRLLQPLFLDHFDQPLTSSWWRELKKAQRAHATMAGAYIVNLIEWYEAHYNERSSIKPIDVPHRPRIDKGVVQGLHHIRHLLLDHLGQDATSDWWAILDAPSRDGVAHADDYLARLVDWYTANHPGTPPN